MPFPRRPRLAIIGARGYPSFYGGFETLLRQLIPYLTDREWEVDVYCRPGVERITHFDGRLAQRYTSGVESKSLSTLSYGLTSAFDARQRTPDVALVMNVANGFWLPLLTSRNIPTLVNVDGIEWDRDKWGSCAKFVFRRGAQMTARYADTLIVDSTEIGRRWEREFGRGGEFIPYGGTDDYAAPALPEHPRGSYALYVARFVPENTIHEFLDAVPRISASADVVIVGSSGYGGPIDARVGALAATNSRVTWLGHVHDDAKLRALWANAGAYFHGHSVGGTNPALVQSMACGSPVVARDTRFNREVLGDESVFVQPTADDIASQMIRMIADRPYAEMFGRANRERQQEYYTWTGVCQGYHELLSRTIGRPVDVVGVETDAVLAYRPIDRQVS